MTSAIVKSGESRYLVEPDVKDGKGGLRDLNTLFWIAKFLYATNSTDELAEKGAFTREELAIFKKCENFLWAVRCHLHFLSKRGDDRLSFDRQSDIAERLGYKAHGGLKHVERFMKHYFLVAKDVGDLTRILCASLEARQVKDAPALSRMLGRLRPRGTRELCRCPGLPPRKRPRRGRRSPDVFTQRSGQHDPALRHRQPPWRGDSSGCAEAGAQVAAADPQERVQRPAGQCDLPRDC